MVTSKSEASRQVDLSDSVAEARSSSYCSTMLSTSEKHLIHGAGLVLPDSLRLLGRLGLVLPDSYCASSGAWDSYCASSGAWDSYC